MLSARSCPPHMIGPMENSSMKNASSKVCSKSVAGVLVALVSVTGCGGSETDAPFEQPSEVSDQAMEDSPYLQELFPSRQDAYDPQLRHQAPPVRIMVDGELREPEEISRFNGRPIIYLMNAESQEGGFVYVFADHQQLRTHLQARGKMPRGEVSGVTAANQNPAVFFVDPSLEGYELKVEPGYALPNLKDVNMAFLRNWNDEISSLTASPVGTYTVLYMHSNYWGSEVWTEAGGYKYDLSWANFDNQASSIKVLW